MVSGVKALASSSANRPKNRDKIHIPSTEREAMKNKEKSGARGRIRTTDTAIFSRLLYQLSYSGIWACVMRLAR